MAKCRPVNSAYPQIFGKSEVETKIWLFFYHSNVALLIIPTITTKTRQKFKNKQIRSNFCFVAKTLLWCTGLHFAVLPENGTLFEKLTRVKKVSKLIALSSNCMIFQEI